ncbi:MAG: DMT family protein [Flavobacteriales bacterium]
MRGLISIGLLVLSNTFMTVAWYGHLRFKDHPTWAKWGLFSVILLSWGIAFFEYCLQVPANRIGFAGYGGPFSLIQLKVIQEVITLVVFVGFTTIAFKDQAFRWNHGLAAVLLVAAVWLVFKK